MLIFVLTWFDLNPFNNRREIKGLLNSVIVASNYHHILKLCSVPMKSINKRSTLTYRNIPIRDFQLN